jgi:catechol 2,3-dioxygenase-like lactoylglutathione lyase family enzyme
MIKRIDVLLSSYERGTLSRRQLLCALAVMTVPVAADSAQTSAGLTKGRNLHHVNVRVADLARSEAFYRKLFGFGPSRRVQGPDNHGFDLPGGGLIILQKSDDAGRIDHFCIGVDGFDADRMRAAVKRAGIGTIQGDAADNFSVIDPNGVRVQISAPSWSA